MRTRSIEVAMAIGTGLFATRALLHPGRRYALEGKTVLITGGSRGLGLALAREFGRHRARLAISARDSEELEGARQDLQSRGAEVMAFPCDLTQREQSQALPEQVRAHFGSVDVLVNNAGVIEVGPLESLALEDFEEAMRTHFYAPLYLTLAVIPAMRRRRQGRIINISSIGGLVSVPHLVPYCASKFALTGLSDSLRSELAKDSIYVTTVCPGMMRTGSPFNAWFKGRHRDEFTWFALSDSIPLMSIDSGRAAAQVIDACRHGDAELIITWPARLAVVANAVMPEAVALAMSLADRILLPGPIDDRSGDERHSGWQSLSKWAPSKLTTLTERAAADNNELPLSAPSPRAASARP